MEECLERCILSVLNQDFTNFELILVNDGSTDNSGDICEKYVQIDSRVKVIHQNNMGQGMARNTGIKASRGDYIGFIDADDWISPNMYRKLYDMCKQYDCEISEVATSVTKVLETKYNYSEDKVNIIEGHKILENYLYEGLKDNTRYSVCNKLYSRSLFDKIRFNKINYSEDYLINFKLLSQVNKIAVSPEKCYYYFQREGSTIHQKLNERNFKNFDNMKEVITLSAKTENKNTIKLARVTHSRLYFSLLLKSMVYGKDKTITNEDINYLYRNLRNNYFNLVRSPMPFNRKVIMSLLVINKKILERLISIVVKNIKGEK